VTGADLAWLALAIGAFVSALAGAWLVERNALRLQLVDLPNVRSSHVEPRPRGGGLGILLGVAVVAVATLSGAAEWPNEVWILLGGALLVSVVGLWDDVRKLNVWPRLFAQVLAAGLVVAGIGGVERLPLPPPADIELGLAAPVLTVVWIVGVTNFFNFMDGFDGLAGGQAMISFGALAWALWPDAVAGLALVLLSATFGFLLRNWSPARIFLGDVGSAFLGFLLAGLPLAAARPARPALVFLVAISMTLFLMDPVVTLVARRRRRAAIGASHRDHAYQQLVAPGRPHGAVVSVLLAVGLALTIVAGFAYTRPALGWPAMAIALITFAIEWRVAARRRARRQ